MSDPVTSDPTPPAVPRVHLGQVNSTSTWAATQVAVGRLTPPAVVTADEQTAGRGRRGKTWVCTQGSVAATFVLAAGDLAPHRRAVVSAVLVRAALAEFDSQVKIKWPNDLLLGGRKIAGILCERVKTAAGAVDLVGVGVNVLPPPGGLPASLVDTAGTLLPDAGRHDAVGAVVDALTRHLTGPPPDWREVLADFARHDDLARAHVRVCWGNGEATGRHAGLDAEGRLRVETASGMKVLTGGTLRRVR